MRLTELLLAGLVFWTVIGLAGSVVSAVQGSRSRAKRGLLSIGGVWAVYVAVLLAVSLVQGGRVIARGEEQCFDEMCFAVQGADEVEGFLARGQDRARLLRVKVQVSNRSKARAESEGLIRAYLMDDRGRRWEEVPGLSGVRLRGRIAAGDTAVSEPIYRVPKDATGLGLVLTHGRWQPGVLVIGDGDSWLHRPTVMRFGP